MAGKRRRALHLKAFALVLRQPLVVRDSATNSETVGPNSLLELQQRGLGISNRVVKKIGNDSLGVADVHDVHQ
jgi:hypothetical protein